MFLYREVKFLKTFDRDEQIEDHFPKDIVDFIISQNRLHVIKNRVKKWLIKKNLNKFQAKIFPPYKLDDADNNVQNAEIVSLLTNFHVKDHLAKIIKRIGTPFRFACDFSMIWTQSKIDFEIDYILISIL